MIELSKDKIIERFRSYVALDTASDDKSETSPSTAKQLKLAKLLKSELSGLGLEDVVLTEYGYVLAALPANTNEKLPVIGLLAHMDTSNEASGANIKMQVHSAYDGSELDLGKGVKLSEGLSRIKKLSGTGNYNFERYDFAGSRRQGWSMRYCFSL